MAEDHTVTTRTGLAALCAVLAAATGAAAPAAPLDEASLYLELNDTDGDLGIHGLLAADAWSELAIRDPGGQLLLEARPFWRLARQGMSELFFESAEPSFDDLPPDAFLRRFPEGDYEVSGRLVGGGRLRATARLSHVLPAAPGNVTVNGLPAAADCDADDLPRVAAPVTIAWDPVTTSHPRIGVAGPVEVATWQIVVEQPDGEHKQTLDLPPEAGSILVAPELLALGDRRYKYEVLVRATSGNQTAIESCFILRR